MFFYILSYFFTTPILQQFFCFKYVFSGSIHGRLILVPSEFMSTNSPHSSSFTCICMSRFFSSCQPGNIRKCPKNFSLQRLLTSQEIFWTGSHTHSTTPSFGDNIFAYSRNEKVKPEKQRRNIMLFSIYMYVFSYSSYSVIYLNNIPGKAYMTVCFRYLPLEEALSR